MFGTEHGGFASILGLPLIEPEVARWAAKSFCLLGSVPSVISRMMNNGIDVCIIDLLNTNFIMARSLFFFHFFTVPYKSPSECFSF